MGGGGIFNPPFPSSLVPNRVKPYFSDKRLSSGKITLVDNNTILTEDKQTVETIINFFISKLHQGKALLTLILVIM